MILIEVQKLKFNYKSENVEMVIYALDFRTFNMKAQKHDDLLNFKS